MPVLFVIDKTDNVAVALEDAQVGEAALTGQVQGTLSLQQPIPRGHKAALREIPAGAAVRKHGHTIAIATKDIAPGEWVHTHNAVSPSAQGEEVQQ